jgi:hypothetical protein
MGATNETAAASRGLIALRLLAFVLFVVRHQLRARRSMTLRDLLAVVMLFLSS